ncbi:hypothetical protein P280DRAFT_517592 [Massarina eburnea CBS 473.64]|uniref:RTA1 like protein n=1 Tax=Massarina eburnea CBS 473.64 TaxID=1395130 RepID=A0A6A6S4P7_9PLEO|nr:hypothetical protein P280DRAFT_517592 [Massarina eburnea CBS 473.64]
MAPTPTPTIFTWTDVLCINLQGTGASLFTNAKGKASMAKVGKVLVLTGLVAQIATFAFFVYVAMSWHRRVVGDANGRKKRAVKTEGFAWVKYMRLLYVVSMIITFRNLFHVTKYAMSEDGYLNAKEWPTYAFDALLMVVVLALCAFWYVGNLDVPFEQNGDSLEMMYMRSTIWTPILEMREMKN